MTASGDGPTVNEIIVVLQFERVLFKPGFAITKKQILTLSPFIIINSHKNLPTFKITI